MCHRRLIAHRELLTDLFVVIVVAGMSASEANAEPAVGGRDESAQSIILPRTNNREAVASMEGVADLREMPVQTRKRATVSPLDRTVGNGCSYATISAAIAAANPGDTLLLEGNRTFTENITIAQDLVIRGGFDGCASGSTERTTIDGGSSGSVVIISGGLSVWMYDLEIIHGVTSAEGGGIQLGKTNHTEFGFLGLERVRILDSVANWGGGVWVGPNSWMQGDDIEIFGNQAWEDGGGIRLFGGGCSLWEASRVEGNQSHKRGGGVASAYAEGERPILYANQNTVIGNNVAVNGDALGGGLYLDGAHAAVSSGSILGPNLAATGGGAYLINDSSLHLVDGDVKENWADQGAGIFADDSTIRGYKHCLIADNWARSGNGGGVYLTNGSGLFMWFGHVVGNSASGDGGGVYSEGLSSVLFLVDEYGFCDAAPCNSLSDNTATNGFGGGLYVNNPQSAYFENVLIQRNTAQYGGGIYAFEGWVSAHGSLFSGNDATVVGDGLRLYQNSGFQGYQVTVAHNDAGGASTGNAIEMDSSFLVLRCSIVWGHAVSINDPNQDVTGSAIEGGYAGAGNADLDPRFVDAAGGDFHLQLTSPVIDTCTLADGLGTDFECQLRPWMVNNATTPFDKGADEAGSRHAWIFSDDFESGDTSQWSN